MSLLKNGMLWVIIDPQCLFKKNAFPFMCMWSEAYRFLDIILHFTHHQIPHEYNVPKSLGCTRVISLSISSTVMLRSVT